MDGKIDDIIIFPAYGRTIYNIKALTVCWTVLGGK